MFTIPTEFSACIPYMQQILWLYNEIEQLKTQVTDLTARVEALEDGVGRTADNEENT
ncbi:MAG: hypothetical protein IIY21_13070 [Clostridiales bacterium]|nr:hypothetical protein [Clostridiales bacterium]